MISRFCGKVNFFIRIDTDYTLMGLGEYRLFAGLSVNIRVNPRRASPAWKLSCHRQICLRRRYFRRGGLAVGYSVFLAEQTEMRSRHVKVEEASRLFMLAERQDHDSWADPA
jgi:hypothetical protein